MTAIQRLRALLAEATPGPWRARKWPSPTRMVEVIADTDPPIVPWTGFDDSDRTKKGHDSNAVLIAAAVNALPALLDVAEAARAWREHLQTPMGRSEQMLRWAEREFQLAELIGVALARLDGPEIAS